MDILTQFEEKIDRLLQRIQTVEDENLRLREELEAEKKQKQEVLSRIDNLLKKIQEAAI
ncbi:cell division protein ZapB [Desulfonatronum zhilinae]|nr:cell division protein ZapB [Desulfonatronum zhilinae]